MFCFPNTRQEILFPSNLVLFTCISGHNQLRRKEKVSGSPQDICWENQTSRSPPRPAPPRPHVSVFLFENGIFFFGLAYCQHDETHLLKTLSRVESFENAGFSFTCGRTQTEVFEYDDAGIHLTLPAWSMLSKGCYRISIVSAFSCGQAKTIQIRYEWVCIFWKRRKKSPFSKISKISGYGLGLRLRPDESAYILFYTNRPSVHTKPVNQLYTLLPKLKKSIYSTLESSQNPSTLFLISQF